MLTGADMTWWSDVVASAYSCREIGQFTANVLPQLPGRFRTVATSCDEFHLRSGAYRLHGLLSETALPDHRPHLHENPNASSLIGDPRSTAIQSLDTISSEAWHRTAFFQYVARPMGWEDQMLVSFNAAGWLGAVGLHRDVPFSAEERFLMELFCPHLQAVMCRLHPSESNDAEYFVYEVSLTPALTVVSPSAIYEWLMQRYFADQPRSGGVPEMLRDHLLQQLGWPADFGYVAPIKKLRVRSARGELAIRCFPYQKDGQITLEMTETPINGARIHFTEREREVLTWLREGKRDAEIGTILGISPKTVGKHVEHILAKTGAPNRTAAAMKIGRDGVER